MLDRHIVGQRDAKRAVAVALRNRWRRHRIAPELRAEIVPKNILMFGPTGCGKTEIARRLAKLANAPFVKVEATKFTEVGFHGRDVDQIIRDLVENAIHLQRQKVRSQIEEEVNSIVAHKIVYKLTGINGSTKEQDRSLTQEEQTTFDQCLQLYYSGDLDSRTITMDLYEGRIRVPLDAMGAFLFKIEKAGRKPQKVEILVKDAKPRMLEAVMEKHLSEDQVIQDAIQLAESDGIVFIDEIDKIVSSHETDIHVDASAEGVQRDLLPIIEGSTVNTKHGNVNTDHILFICSGAFHSCKPSDMLAELQSRLPIRIELKGLTCEDLYRILTEPETNMIKQQVLLMRTEDIDLIFTDDAIKELANFAAEMNKSLHNIGARRLHTVVERVVEDISFHAPKRARSIYVINKEKVKESVGNLLSKTDLTKFVL